MVEWKDSLVDVVEEEDREEEGAANSCTIREAWFQHNAHFRNKRCQKQRQRVPKTAPLAPRIPRDREPFSLGGVVRNLTVALAQASKRRQY
jgi:hypothetical protein